MIFKNKNKSSMNENAFSQLHIITRDVNTNEFKNLKKQFRSFKRLLSYKMKTKVIQNLLSNSNTR